MNRAFFLGVGFLVWLVATVMFRVIGQEFFLIDDTLVMIVVWVVTAASLYGFALFLFSFQSLTRQQFYQAAALLVIPGMVLDALAIQFFEDVFPDLEVAADGPVGAWLLMGYASVLIASVRPFNLER